LHFLLPSILNVLLLVGDNSTATDALLRYPSGVCGIPNNSNYSLVIVDSGNHVLRTVSNGIINTRGGTGINGSDDGFLYQSPYATLNFPISCRGDKDGNILIADSMSNKIRLLNTTQSFILTIIGSGNYGSFDSYALLSAIQHPYGVFSDQNGTIYFSDTFGNRIRVLSSDGNTTTIAGPDNSSVINPRGIYVNSEGKVYFANYGDGTVRLIDQSGNNLLKCPFMLRIFILFSRCTTHYCWWR
jgi:DNA-binding beta-propeller fold protein YncE